MLTVSAAQYKRMSSPPATHPVDGKYWPYGEWTVNPNTQDTVFYYGRCNRAAVDQVVGRIAAEGQRRLQRSRGALLTTRIQIDALQSTRNAYQSAERECGFDYTREIGRVEASLSQAKANEAQLFARPNTNVNTGNVASFIGGLASVIGATGGVGGSTQSDCPPSHTVCK